jgi:uncharacterized protein (DUF2384 family)
LKPSSTAFNVLIFPSSLTFNLLSTVLSPPARSLIAENAQQNLLRYSLKAVPIATATKVEALRIDFKSGAAVADLLGVSRSRVSRWLRGAGIDPLNAERVDLLELVWSNLLRLYDPETARSWLFGLNPMLGDRRPIDLIRAGKAEELMRAIRAERADSFA